MSLTAAMETARQSLSVISSKTSVASRNVANASVPFASRKTVGSYSAPGGLGVVVGDIRRISDKALLTAVLSANSEASQHQATVDALDQLEAALNDPELDASPAALIGKLADAIQQYAASPSDLVRGQSAVFAAQDVARSLNGATDTVQNVRAQADEWIAGSVETINSLLSQFDEVNTDIIIGTGLGNDITDNLDTRDRILNDLSQELGIRTISQPNNGMAIYTDGGVTLYNSSPRTVTFTATPTYGAATTGNAVYIDGQAVTGTGATMPLGSGRILGYAEFRDETAVTFQNQLDEMARGLIEMFAESDQTGGGAPDATGLFSYSGSPTVPPAGTLIPGLAREFTVNTAFDPLQGGDTTLLRDGGANGAAYDYNPTNAAGFAVRLNDLFDTFDAVRSFDSAAGIGTSSTIQTFSAYSVGWLEENRSTASGSLEYSLTVQERASTSLQQVTGVNLDYEMSLLLELEYSYQATARLLSTIDSMYAALLAAV